MIKPGQQIDKTFLAISSGMTLGSRSCVSLGSIEFRFPRLGSPERKPSSISQSPETRPRGHEPG